MKVLIVDDEEHVRDGIELSIDWEKYGVHHRMQAENGIEAIELIRQHHPDILFCDMKMPGMNGVELLEIARKESQQMQIIVVSGYNDFEYAKATIKANGLDYILKPFRKQDLERAFEQAVTACREKRQSEQVKRDTGFRLKQADLMLLEQKIAQYLRGELPYHPSIQEDLRKVGLPEEKLRATWIVLQNKSELIQQRYHGDSELFSFAFKNIAQEILQKQGSHYVCRLDEYSCLLLTGSDQGNSLLNKHLYNMKKVEESWREAIDLQVLYGVSADEAGLKEIQVILTQARDSLLQAELATHPSQQAQSSMNTPSVSSQEALLRVAVTKGDKRSISEIIHSFAEQLDRCPSLTLEDLQRHTREMNLLIEQVYSKLNLSVHHPSIPIWICHLKEWEQWTIQAWWNLIEEIGLDDNSNWDIHSIRLYIEEHYQENISLSTLSDMFFFSPQYIAKKFKELFQTTVITYQMELRMDKAKSLLKHTNMSVSEIAQTVGYADENYFSKVFRKQQGVSPLKYRKES